MLGFQLLNGLTFAALLFVVASGFTLVFGLLRIVNLAHGALYLMGGYVAYEVGGRTGYFALGVVAAMVAVALAGWALALSGAIGYVTIWLNWSAMAIWPTSGARSAVTSET